MYANRSLRARVPREAGGPPQSATREIVGIRQLVQYRSEDPVRVAGRASSSFSATSDSDARSGARDRSA